jgi:hypothetical protein
LPGSAAYEEARLSYYSAQQAALEPSCRIFPTTAQEVAIIIRAVKQYGVPFAVKGAGHGIQLGASNIAGGIAIDLSQMSTTSILASGAHRQGQTNGRGEEDGTIVEVGPGSRWGAVYDTLDRTGFAVAGGRLGDVGVAGYLLGGGISHFSGRVGWACDAVEYYEVVLSNGEIVNASIRERSDLFWALKGGSNQFGVVTKFGLRAWRQDAFFGGVVLYAPEMLGQVCDGIAAFNERSDEDIHTAGHFALVLRNKSGQDIEMDASFIFANSASNTSSPVFAKLDAVPNLWDFRDVYSLRDQIPDGGDPRGYRQWEATLTLKNSAEAMKAIFKIINDNTKKFSDRLGGDGFVGITLQPLTKPYLAHSNNALGIDPSDAPLLMHFLQIRWTDAADDDFFNKLGAEVFAEIEAVVTALGAYHPYRYINYAASFQDVFSSYGTQSKEMLLRIRNKYNPDDVFETLMPGGQRLST